MSESKNEFQKCKVCGAAVVEVNPTYHLVECVDCKLVFCKIIFTQEKFIETYDRLYNDSNTYQKHQKEYESLKSGTKVSIGLPKKKIMTFFLKKRLVDFIEIGAGIGVIAQYIQNKKLNYYGIELDKKSVKKAQHLGLHVEQGDFSFLKSINFKADAVLAFEVMEHIQDLDLFMKLISNQLKSGGYYGFTVPNYDKRKNYFQPSDKIYQAEPPIHLNFFTKDNVLRLADFYGFSIEFCNLKKTPYFNYNSFETYKFMFKALLGKYHGPTLICVMKKK